MAPLTVVQAWGSTPADNFIVVTLPPADWYDDPENARQYRYWDGTQWTEHRSPKGLPAPPGRRSDDSAGSIFGKVFALLASTWREAVIVAVPIAIGTLVGAGLIYFGVNDAVNVDVQELLDRVTTPGFDPDSGDDKIFIDSIDVTVSGTAIVTTLIGAIVWTLGASLSVLGLSRLFVAANNGVEIGPGAALRGGLHRIPRLLLLVLQAAAAILAVSIVMAIVGVIAPVVLLLVVPATLAIMVWLAPYMTVALVATAAGPRQVGVIATTRSAMAGRWRHVVLRLLLLVLLGIGLGLPIGAVSNAVFAVSLWGYALLTALVQAFQMVVSGAGYTIIYDGIDAPVDPELTPSAT